ncbi:MAG TPA: DUF5069 domain-containing protein [Candidatus Elarobacter sp.]|jgi:hypothetical protein
MGSTTSVPRRWSDELDGVRWLPRMIDKARMRDRGDLGSYLLGHSPVDHALLTRLGLSTERFAEIVQAAPDDDAVLAAVRTTWDEARVRRWSERFTSTYRGFIPMWDIDEGYAQATPLQALGLALYRPFESVTMEAVRRFRRAP